MAANKNGLNNVFAGAGIVGTLLTGAPSFAAPAAPAAPSQSTPANADAARLDQETKMCFADTNEFAKDKAALAAIKGRMAVDCLHQAHDIHGRYRILRVVPVATVPGKPANTVNFFSIELPPTPPAPQPVAGEVGAPPSSNTPLPRAQGVHTPPAVDKKTDAERRCEAEGQTRALRASVTTFLESEQGTVLNGHVLHATVNDDGVITGVEYADDAQGTSVDLRKCAGIGSDAALLVATKAFGNVVSPVAELITAGGIANLGQAALDQARSNAAEAPGYLSVAQQQEQAYAAGASKNVTEITQTTGAVTQNGGAQNVTTGATTLTTGAIDVKGSTATSSSAGVGGVAGSPGGSAGIIVQKGAGDTASTGAGPSTGGISTSGSGVTNTGPGTAGGAYANVQQGTFANGTNSTLTGPNSTVATTGATQGNGPATVAGGSQANGAAALNQGAISGQSSNGPLGAAGADVSKPVTTTTTISASATGQSANTVGSPLAATTAGAVTSTATTTGSGAAATGTGQAVGDNASGTQTTTQPQTSTAGAATVTPSAYITMPHRPFSAGLYTNAVLNNRAANSQVATYAL